MLQNQIKRETDVQCNVAEMDRSLNRHGPYTYDKRSFYVLQNDISYYSN